MHSKEFTKLHNHLTKALHQCTLNRISIAYALLHHQCAHLLCRPTTSLFVFHSALAHLKCSPSAQFIDAAAIPRLFRPYNIGQYLRGKPSVDSARCSLGRDTFSGWLNKPHALVCRTQPKTMPTLICHSSKLARSATIVRVALHFEHPPIETGQEATHSN